MADAEEREAALRDLGLLATALQDSFGDWDVPRMGIALSLLAAQLAEPGMSESEFIKMMRSSYKLMASLNRIAREEQRPS